MSFNKQVTREFGQVKPVDVDISGTNEGALTVVGGVKLVTGAAGSLSFFGTTGHVKTVVSTISASADLTATTAGLNGLITALKGYGLI